MLCPKCKAKIGLHRFKGMTRSQFSQGITCSVCGYWSEPGIQARKGERKGPSRTAKNGND